MAYRLGERVYGYWRYDKRWYPAIIGPPLMDVGARVFWIDGTYSDLLPAELRPQPSPLLALRAERDWLRAECHRLRTQLAELERENRQHQRQDADRLGEIGRLKETLLVLSNRCRELEWILRRRNMAH